jgi:hypothetical protein
MATVLVARPPKKRRRDSKPDDARITLRQGARVIEDSRRLRTV